MAPPVQTTLPFTRNLDRVRELSPTNSDSLSSLPSSQFDAIKDPFDSLQSAPCSRRRYASSTQSKSKLRPRTSWVYNHMPDKERETKYQSTEGRDEWRCAYCPQRYLVDGGTSIITTHLISKHGLEQESVREQQVKNQQRTINEVLREAENRPQKKRKLYYRVYGDKINGTVLEILWVNVLVVCSLAIRLLCLPQFRAFLQYLNVEALAFLPTSTNTVREWVMRQYYNRKETMKSKLQAAKSKIHISCDLWTSPNSLVILGIIAHYVDEDGKLQRSNLALKSIIGDHTGEHLAEVILKVLQEWGIVSKLGFFMMDNAQSNDVLLRVIQRGICTNSTTLSIANLVLMSELSKSPWKLKYDSKLH